MSCPSYLVALGQQIWNDLGQPADQPVSYIQSRLTGPSFVGQLGLLTSDCLTSVSGAIDPVLTQEQQALAQLLYERDYYSTKLAQTLAGLNPGVIEIREADSTVRFTNPVEQAKVYKEMQRQLNEQLNLAIATYRIDKSLPNTVTYPLIVNLVGGYGYSTVPAGGGPHAFYR